MGGTFQLYIRFPYISSSTRSSKGEVLPPLDLPMGDYFEALYAELSLRGRESKWQNKALRSVHIGGSSVWIYYPKLMERLLEHLVSAFRLQAKHKVYLRIDPEHVTSSNLDRLDLFPNTALTLRTSLAGTPASLVTAQLEQTQNIFELVQAQRGEKFELDHCLGYQGQSKESFAGEAKLLAFSGSSQIRIQDRLPAYRQARSDGSELYRKQQVLYRALECTGYEKCAPGLFSICKRAVRGMGLYNSVLGIGAGARTRFLSKNGSAFRSINASSAKLHVERLQSVGRSEFFHEELSTIDQYHEWVAAHLRIRGTVPIDRIRDRFGIRIEVTHPGIFEVLEDMEFGHRVKEHGANQFVLTELGQANVYEITNLLRVAKDERALVLSDLSVESHARNLNPLRGAARLSTQMLRSIRDRREENSLSLPQGVAVAGPGGSK